MLWKGDFVHLINSILFILLIAGARPRTRVLEAMHDLTMDFRHAPSLEILQSRYLVSPHCVWCTLQSTFPPL